MEQPLTIQQIKLLIKQQTDYQYNELESQIYAANTRIDKLVKINQILIKKVKALQERKENENTPEN